MSIPDSRVLLVDIAFTRPIDFSTFPYTTFQTITISDPTISLSQFTVSYIVMSDRSYRIEIKPIDPAFYMNNVTFTTDINTYTNHFYTSDGYQISPATYDLVESILW